jgi:hypothetical protein
MKLLDKTLILITSLLMIASIYKFVSAMINIFVNN